MLRHLGEEKVAQLVEEGVWQVMREGLVLTPDLKGTSSTAEVGDAVVSALGYART